MNPHIKTFERITELVSLLASGDFKSSVRNISEKTETPLSQTREDLAQLHRLGIRLHPGDKADLLQKGDPLLDDVVFELDSELPVRNPLLFLNSTQKSLFLDKRVGRMLIKDTSFTVSDNVIKHREQIKKAIRDRSYVLFRYRSPRTGKSEQVEIAPIKLFHNTTNNRYYCVCFDENDRIYTYRLDRIVFDVHILSGRHYENLHEKAVSRMDYVWGAAFENDSEPVHIKLEILDDTPGILRKIELETKPRKYARISKEGDRYFYEDEVIGLSSLRTWIFSYGSALKVIEPESLAQTVLDSSGLRLLNYEDGNRFHSPSEIDDDQR